MTCHPQLLGNFIYLGHPVLALLAKPRKFLQDLRAVLSGRVEKAQVGSR